MRAIVPMLLLMTALTGCKNELAEPWAQVNYTEAGCGTKDAVLTTVGCAVNPAVSSPAVVAVTPGSVTVTSGTATANPAVVVDETKVISDPNDVSSPGVHSSHR